MVMKDVRAGLIQMKVTVIAAVLLFALIQTALGGPCDGHGDCDDGKFCTGVETCDNLQCSTFDYFTDYPCRGSGQDSDCNEVN